MKRRLFPMGDSAALVQLGMEIDPAINRRVHALDARLRARMTAGVTEIVPAYASLLVHYDPLMLTYHEVENWLRAEMSGAEDEAAKPMRKIEIPVRYGGEDGPDLEYVAREHRLTARRVAEIHAGREYAVYMMGFTPGFAYMGTLDPAIATPRLETPRALVPAGSVGIAGAQTGIYPIGSPGGWRILGRTALKLFDPNAESPFLFSPGDSVRFVVEAVNA